MQFLKRERITLEEFLPTLDKRLAETPLKELERRNSTSIRAFREVGGPALLIPTEYGGLGATLLQAIRIQRAIASRSPSLAVATTMHHSTVAAIVELCTKGWGPGIEQALLKSIAQQRLLVASGFAEGRTGANDLAPLMEARRTPDGFIVSGSKKPCSLTWSMDLLAACVRLRSESAGNRELGIVLIPADATGIERRPFWESRILAGAESDEVVLHDVLVPEEFVFNVGNPDELNRALTTGFLWFELLIAASYLGTASALVERALEAGKGEPPELALLGIEVEGAMSALEGVAWSKMMGRENEDEFARALFVRYAVQRAVERVTTHAVELLGGIAFIRSFEVSYLFAAAHALAFHPPSRMKISSALADYLVGAPLRLE